MGTILVYRLQVHGGSKTEAPSACSSHAGLGVGGTGFSSQLKRTSCFLILHLFREAANIFSCQFFLAGRPSRPPSTGLSQASARFPARRADAGPRAEQKGAGSRHSFAPTRTPAALARRSRRKGEPAGAARGWTPDQLGGTQAAI